MLFPEIDGREDVDITISQRGVILAMDMNIWEEHGEIVESDCRDCSLEQGLV